MKKLTLSLSTILFVTILLSSCANNKKNFIGCYTLNTIQTSTDNESLENSCEEFSFSDSNCESNSEQSSTR